MKNNIHNKFKVTLKEVKKARKDPKDTRWSDNWCLRIAQMFEHCRECGVCKLHYDKWFEHTFKDGMPD